MTCIEKTGRQIISTNFANIQKEFTNVKSAFGYFACNKHVILKCFLKVKIIIYLLLYYCAADHIVTISRQKKTDSEWPVKAPSCRGLGVLRLGQIPKFDRILFLIASLTWVI